MISVIVPVYNVEKYVANCIESILAQTYKDIEIILVDDGSKDASGKICDEYQEKDSRIQVIHKENGGLSDARNAGMDIATGEYYVFVDSDDCIHSQMIETLLFHAKETNADLTICNFQSISEDEEPQEKNIDISNVASDSFHEDLYDLIYCKNLLTVVAWNKLYRKEIFSNLRYPVGKLHEDEFIVHLVLSNCQIVTFLDTELYFYRNRANSIMTTPSLKSIKDGYEATLVRRQFLNEEGNERNKAQAVFLSLIFATKFYQSVKKEYRDERFAFELQRTAQNEWSSFLKELIGEENFLKYKLFENNPKAFTKYCIAEEKNNFEYKIRRKLLTMRKD